MLSNKILLITLLVWAIAQCLKVVLGVIRERKFNFRWFIGTGGMPSSHAAGACALATLVGMQNGFSSTLFAITAVMALVTMFDAQGARRCTGQQAEILNRIIDDFYFTGKTEFGRVVAFFGHTPFQVFIGGMMGSLLAAVFYHLWVK